MNIRALICCVFVWVERLHNRVFVWLAFSARVRNELATGVKWAEYG